MADHGAPLLLGLVGQGIARSRSPAMHEAEAARHGLPLVSRLLDTDAMAREATIGEVIAAAELMGFAGLDVTHPCKMAAIDFLDGLSDAARAIGCRVLPGAAGREISIRRARVSAFQPSCPASSTLRAARKHSLACGTPQ